MSKIVSTELAEEISKSAEDIQGDVDSAYLRATNIIKSINANLPNKDQIAPIPDDFVPRRVSKETRSAAVDATFELLGGVPFMMAWAKANPTKFMELWSKHALSDAGGPTSGVSITIQTAIPDVPNDHIVMDSNGKAIVPDVEDADYTDA